LKNNRCHHLFQNILLYFKISILVSCFEKKDCHTKAYLSSCPCRVNLLEAYDIALPESRHYIVVKVSTQHLQGLSCHINQIMPIVSNSVKPI